MEKSLKQQIVNATEAVKKKVRQIQDIDNENKNKLVSVFKPVTDPLNELININKINNFKSEELNSPLNKTLIKRKSDVMSEDEFDYNRGFKINTEDELESDNPSENEIFLDKGILENSNSSFKTVDSGESSNKNISAWSLSSEVFTNVPYGVRRERGKLMLGSARFFMDDHYFKIAGRNYECTDGLKQLLFEKSPDLSQITSEDLKSYKSMLMETNAHRRDFDSKKPIKTNKGQKYLKIIKPLFRLRKETYSTDGSVSKGDGLTLMKKFKKDVDFVYWDDPNELVERLKLLLASRDAGNTGVGNEIISIIEELRESGVLN